MTMSGTGKMRGSQASGFTLVELVIAITVLAILGGLASPAIDSVQRERQAREPINNLYLLAREVRLRSMSERRPYQIVFDREGFKASRFFHPYGGSEEFEKLRIELDQLAERQEMIDASRARGIDLSTEEKDLQQAEIEDGLQYFREYQWPNDVECSLRFWDEMQWAGLSGGEFHRWIFQPSGMCEPLKVRMEADGAYFEVEFHPLTADIRKERSWVE